MSNDHSQGIGRRITRYGTILSISGILCKLLLLVYTIFAVDVLGEAGFGRIEYFIEIAIIVTVLLDFGLEQTVTRELARRRNEIKSVLIPLLSFRLLASFIGGFLMLGFLLGTAKEGHTLPLMLCAVLYFFVVSNIMLIRAVIRSLEWLTIEGIANLLDKLVHISLAMLVLLTTPSLGLLMLCYSAGASISLAIYGQALWNDIRSAKASLSLAQGMEWQRLAIPIGLSAACILLLHRQDTVMVNWIRDDAETGLYRAPYRLLEGLFLFPQVLAISAYPVFSKLFHEKQPFEQTAALLLRGLLLLSLPIAVGGMFVGHELISTLMDRLEPRSGDVFVILLWSLPFIYANFLLGTILNATNQQNKNLRASAWGMACNALLNIPAIYGFGALGAAVMTMVAQGLYCVLMIYDTRAFNLFRDTRRYFAILASCLGMALALWLASYSWYVEIMLGAGIYATMIVLLRGVSHQDIQNVLRVVRRR